MDASAYTALRVSSLDEVARVTLDRPARHNAFDEVLVAELTDALDRLAASSAVRVVVLAAAGKSFCAGADLAWLRRLRAQSPERTAGDAEQMTAMFHRLFTLPQPTLALVQGGAYGGGLGLVAACDLAIAATDARFALPETRLGLIPAAVGWYVQQAIGARAAARYALTGERFTAAEAQRLGLVHAVVSAAELAPTGEAWSETILGNGPQAVAAAKRLLAELRDRPLEPSLVGETARRIAAAARSDEAREGIGAFLEKRPPSWRAR